MDFTHKRVSAAVALIVGIAICQAYIGASFAATTPGAEATAAGQQVMGILTTSDNKPITVNGASARNGATIPSGSTIETPAGVGATIKLGPLGTLCISAGTKLSLTFDGQGNVVNVTLLEGCAILRTPKNVSGVLNGPQGALGNIDAAAGGSVDACMKNGVAQVNQGAAADAGAGSSLADCGAAGAAAAPVGIPPAVAGAFIGGGAAGLYLLFRGGNPSPSGP